jgi:acetyl-CoA carboxylase carboxyltransferase component
VRGATGETVDAEALGGARLHTQVSGVAHHRAKDDPDCLKQIRRQFTAFPSSPKARHGQAPSRPVAELTDLLPADHRAPYSVDVLLEALFDAQSIVEFQPDHAPEMLCAEAMLDGRPVALLVNRRGFLRTAQGPRVGGVVYADSARKAAFFVDKADRQGLPLIYLQDVTGFMIGTAAESEGIIRAGAEMVESMACATVPKIVVTINHASGAGYYAMAGQGFDPHFTLAWPSARIGVMEGESAVQAVHGPDIESYKASGEPLPEKLQNAIGQTRADYEKWLDATHSAARGHVDAIIEPEQTRETLIFLLDVATENGNRRHLVLETL